MSFTGIAEHVPFGLLEFDSSGTIIYSNIEESARAPRANLAGLKFDEVICCSNAAELRRHIDRFRQADHGADGFDFICRYADGSVAPVRILLARMRERSNHARTKSILVHIRRAV